MGCNDVGGPLLGVMGPALCGVYGFSTMGMILHCDEVVSSDLVG